MIDVTAIGEVLIGLTCQNVDEFGYPSMDEEEVYWLINSIK